MQIGSVGIGSYQPYIYNTNTISRGSLNKINKIGDDLLASKTDFSGLTEEQQNINPLKRGETVNFGDLMSMQLHMSQMNAARVMQEPKAEEISATEPFRPITQAADTMINKDMEQYMQAVNSGMGSTLDFMV